MPLYIGEKRGGSYLLPVLYKDRYRGNLIRLWLGELYKVILDILFSYATQNQLNLVIDEITGVLLCTQNYFADMQELWDKYKSDMKINFITCGSIYSLMKELFEDKKSA